VASVAGWRGYEWWTAKKAMEAGSAFEAAMTLSEAGQHAESGSAFAKIATDGTSGYRYLARMRQATELAQTDSKSAVTAYQQIAADSAAGPVLRDLAALRAASLMIDQGSYAEARKILEPLAAADRPFRHTARELLALATWRSGDVAEAKRWFDMMTTDSQTPPATRSRVEMLMALVAAEGKS
jgi:hypothetical protein